MEIEDLLSGPAQVMSRLKVGGKKQAIQELAHRAGELTGIHERKIFDVLLENQLKLDNLDIFAEAGGYTLLVKTLQTTVTDGQLNINFVQGSADDPLIGAIEILSN